MTFKPAHKDTTRPPGQIVNEVTLADYLHNKGYTTPTMSFEEWCNQTTFTGKSRKDEWQRAGISLGFVRQVWNAAQENK